MSMTAAGFSKKSITSGKSLGQCLRDARVKKDASLDAVEHATKIRQHYLEAMEQDRWEAIPPSHVRGFVRRYADYLGCDREQIQQDLLLVLPVAGGAQQFRPNVIDQDSRWVVTPKNMAIVCSIVVLLGFISYVTYQVRLFAAPPLLEITNPHHEGSVVTTDTVTVEGRTEPGAFIYIDNLQTSAGSTGAFSYPLALRPGLNQITVRAENRIRKQSVRVVSVLYQPGTTPEPQVSDADGSPHAGAPVAQGGRSNP